MVSQVGLTDKPPKLLAYLRLQRFCLEYAYCI